jgi:hypothetical protein
MAYPELDRAYDVLERLEGGSLSEVLRDSQLKIPNRMMCWTADKHVFEALSADIPSLVSLPVMLTPPVVSNGLTREESFDEVAAVDLGWVVSQVISLNLWLQQMYDILQRLVFQRVMSACVLLLPLYKETMYGIDWMEPMRLLEVGGDEDSSRSKSPSLSSSTSATKHSDSRKRRMDGHDTCSNDSGQYGGAGDGDESKVNLAKRRHISSSRLNLACPFYKFDPHKFAKQRICCGPGWDSVHRIKYVYHARRMMCT